MSWKRGNRLPVVTEAQAQGRVGEIYEEFKRSLGLPYVSVVYQVYGGFPKFLQLHWEILKPVVQTEKFFELADRLRADAYTRMHNYFEIPDMCAQIELDKFSAGARQELTNTVDLFQYHDPLMLLIVVAQMHAFEGPVGDANAPREPASHPVFTPRPILVDEENAPPNVKKIFEEMKRTFGMPLVMTDYRALARWPEFLQAFWKVLKLGSESPLYQQCQHGVRETAWSLAQELPGPFELSIETIASAGVDEESIGSIVRLTDVFSHSLGAMLLNVALAKIGLDGGNRSLKAVKSSAQEAEKAGGPPRAA